MAMECINIIKRNIFISFRSRVIYSNEKPRFDKIAEQ